MASLYLLVPLGVIVIGGAIAILAWAVNHGQFDDLKEISSRLPDDEP